MITTKEFALTPNKLFSILVKNYFTRRWWLLLWLLAIGVFLSLVRNKTSMELFFIIFALLYPLMIAVRFWMHAYSSKNRIFFIPRHFEIYDDRLTARIEDGSDSTIMAENITKIKGLKNEYLLYISEGQFIYMPKNAFESNEDLQWFEEHFMASLKNAKRT